MDAADALAYQKQLTFVPMGKEQLASVKAAFFNKLLIPNPIFEEHEAMIKASQAAWIKQRDAKKSDGSEKRNSNSTKT